MTDSAPAVLFVCLGNICRSPLAEAAFRRTAEAANLVLEIDSAGTGDWHVGHPPDPRARDVALRHGCDISHYRARQIERDDFARFTHIFALDHANLADLRRLAPKDARYRIQLLLDLVEDCKGMSVADPYWGDDADFERTWREVSAAAEVLTQLLLAGA